VRPAGGGGAQITPCRRAPGAPWPRPEPVRPANASLRDFLLGNYTEMKKGNPDFPILVRECAGAEAKLIARYGAGARGRRRGRRQQGERGIACAPNGGGAGPAQRAAGEREPRAALRRRQRRSAVPAAAHPPLPPSLT
jgi:hypothetical protein